MMQEEVKEHLKKMKRSGFREQTQSIIYLVQSHISFRSGSKTSETGSKASETSSKASDKGSIREEEGYNPNNHE